MNTFRDFVHELAQRPTDNPALVAPGGDSWTYHDLATRVRRLSSTLPPAEKSRPVAILLPNGPEFVETFLALAYRGDIIAPLNSTAPAAVLREQLKDLNAQSVVGGSHSDLGVPRWRATKRNYKTRTPHPDDTVLHLQTSGTTSKPKNVLLSHGQLLVSAQNIAAAYELSEEDRSLLVVPLFHVHGLVAGLLATLASGGTVIMPGPFSASGFWASADEYGATWTTAVPAILHILNLTADRHERGQGSLRFIRSCSSALDPALWESLEARFGCPVLEAYGMTEASHQMTSNPLPPKARKPGSVGLATGVELSIRDEKGKVLPQGEVGEVCLSGPTVIRQYHADVEANRSCFYKDAFRTGDQGYLDEEGYLYLNARLKELINRAGEKISPVRIDEAINAHPAVVEVRCFGLPDPVYGEVVGAAVVSAEPVAAEELQAFLRDRLTAHEIPERWFFVEALPKGPTGKVSRMALSTTFAAQS
jgi:acyl-CoA synthetase (AMP-forming)/AMP-acid ligase II